MTGESKLILRVTGGIARSCKAWRWRLRAQGEQGVYVRIKYLNKLCSGQFSSVPTQLVGLPARASPVLVDLPKRCMFNPWIGTTSWSWIWHSTSVFLPGESHRQISLAGYSP